MNRTIVGNVEESKVAIVTEDLMKRGITTFDLRNGNDCVWASYGRVNAYYIIREDKIKDVIYD